MNRRRNSKFGKWRQALQEGSKSGMLVRVMVGLCVVSSMVLVLQLNLTNQHNLMLKNIKGVDEPRAWSAQPASPTCLPHRHLVFLKTHKCGSSTVQNIFMRYASTNNLSVALPFSGVYLDTGTKSQGIRVKDLKDSPFAPPSGKYNFVIHHTRLNVRAIQQLTYDDSMWVTIVREPSAVFESLFHYYSLHEFYGATFDHLVWKLGGNDGGKFRIKNSHRRYLGRLGRNQMSFDLGLDQLDTRLEDVLKQAIQLLDNTFHLVMVAEKMDESLVLLKHLLCWRDEDMVAISCNVRKDRYRSYLSKDLVATLEHYNAADLKLYKHFKDRFEKQVEEFGQGRMEMEVARMREYREKVWHQCGMKETSPSARQRDQHKYLQLVLNYQPHSNGSQRHQGYCKDLVRPSSEFTQVLRWKQYSRYHQNTNNPWNLTWSHTLKRRSGKRKPPRRGSAAFQSHRFRPGRPLAQSKHHGRRKDWNGSKSTSLTRAREGPRTTSPTSKTADKQDNYSYPLPS